MSIVGRAPWIQMRAPTSPSSPLLQIEGIASQLSMAHRVLMQFAIAKPVPSFARRIALRMFSQVSLWSLPTFSGAPMGILPAPADARPFAKQRCNSWRRHICVPYRDSRQSQLIFHV